MDTIFEILKSHRSIRKYKSEPIPEKLLENILTSARQAPTSSNLQTYSIIVVKDTEKKKTLARLCGNQPWVEKCPVFLVMCPDLHRLERVCHLRGYELNDKYIELFIVAVVDTALVAQNILVAAEASGLGICFIGGVRNNPEPISGLLKLPTKVFPLFGICLGYPDTDAMIKPRLVPEAVIHSEEYCDDKLEALIADYDRIIKSTGLYEGPSRKVKPLDQRAISDEDYSWSEHSSRRAASTDPAVLRTHLKEFLDSRGFRFD